MSTMCTTHGYIEDGFVVESDNMDPATRQELDDYLKIQSSSASDREFFYWKSAVHNIGKNQSRALIEDLLKLNLTIVGHLPELVKGKCDACGCNRTLSIEILGRKRRTRSHSRVKYRVGQSCGYKISVLLEIGKYISDLGAMCVYEPRYHALWKQLDGYHRADDSRYNV